jgi:hypothetical protein
VYNHPLHTERHTQVSKSCTAMLPLIQQAVLLMLLAEQQLPRV